METLEIVVERASQLARLPLVAQRLARLCDGKRTRAELGQGENARILERLLALGVVAVRQRPPQKRRPLSHAARTWLEKGELPLFAEDEEAFFAQGHDLPEISA